MRVEEVLQNAAGIMGTFEWTQGAMARDHEGKEVAAINATAVSICLTCAVYRATRDYNFSGRATVRKVALDWVDKTTGRVPSEFNDEIATSKEEVVVALQRAAGDCAVFHGRFLVSPELNSYRAGGTER